MEENTEYKPFAFIEQYDPEVTGFYNTVRTLAATKNDCSLGVVGSSITLTADANHFVSEVSVVDANEQADAWLVANAQAYANNSGTCILVDRSTAWRGTNPTCIIEPTTTLSAFEYMVVSYKWALGAGVDFDTFTGIVNTGTTLDNKYMGYGHQQGTELPNGASAANSHIMWAGDNTQSNGVESCLVNFSKITTDYPDLNAIQVRMAGAWFNSVGTGNIDIEVTTYLGGTMSKSGFDIINTGGTQIQQLTFSKNIPKPPNWSNNVNAVTNIGYITYSKDSSTGQIAITY